MFQLAGKVIRSLRQRGLRGTVSAMMDKLRLSRNERRLGIHTAGKVGLDELGIDNPSLYYYFAVEYEYFTQAMAEVPVGGDGVFVDYGSGKGRAVLLAATYPFRKVIGVEISSQLHDAAQANLRSALPRLRCKDVELLCLDACAWELPDESTVVHFFNPFHGEVLARVVQAIRRSLQRRPRRLTIIYFNPPHFEQEVAWQDWLSRTKELHFPAYRCCIFQTK
jgi:SAM-dependent methyltransferase